MKILAINGSPNARGVTMSLVEPFLAGAKAAGAETELFHAGRLKINACRGDFNCWFATPGRCSQNDDMQMLYPKLREADIWVLASPLYVGGLSGPLKMILDRIIPLVEPFMVVRDGRSRHPLRPGTKGGGIVLISNCGMWEMENFEPLLAHVKEICAHANREFCGALLRPHGPALPELPGFITAGVFRAAKEAGREVAMTGIISAKTSTAVSRELVPHFLYEIVANRNFRKKVNKVGK